MRQVCGLWQSAQFSLTAMFFEFLAGLWWQAAHVENPLKPGAWMLWQIVQSFFLWIEVCLTIALWHFEHDELPSGAYQECCLWHEMQRLCALGTPGGAFPLP
jgi:hypothetical protein